MPYSGVHVLPNLEALELVHMPWADLTPFQARPDIEIIQR